MTLSIRTPPQPLAWNSSNCFGCAAATSTRPSAPLTLLIQGGGFGLIALDLSDIPPQIVRYVPLNTWFRFRRAVEDTSTILVILEQEPNAKTCASLVLLLGSEPAIWSSTSEEGVPPFGITRVGGSRGTQAAVSFPHSCACLLDSFPVRAELLRSRMQPCDSHFHLQKTGTSAEILSYSIASESPVGASPFVESGRPWTISRESLPLNIFKPEPFGVITAASPPH